ncbi:polyprenyl synthetase family protein [Streptomyces halobius]|uniref:Polyprenyl synthetase family protein n=1 Tax=Streptomyces halobius TaxID=2879846 RepID=A0ABY4LYL9_9ACTN|nr:polyprenyl synthetase family protein [Streptomyces halobius]UQA90594.1 polyprenyl synthetase family protein [Streptomyces halobius]
MNARGDSQTLQKPPDRPDTETLGRFLSVEPALKTSLDARLAQTEMRLRDCVRTAPAPRITALTSHLAVTGGKRLRPLMVLLSSEFGEPGREGITRAAVVAELVHLASLYHDDVLDHATTRHGVPSANALWGEKTAVRGGNWLLARSVRLSADLGEQAVGCALRATSRLVDGQLRELLGPSPGEDPVDHYFKVAEGKTGALISMSVAIGALQAAAPQPYVEALRAYGEQLGLAFQISDDILDLTVPGDTTGKQQGKDLLGAVDSLPVLLARADTSADGAELRTLLSSGPFTGPAAHLRALELFQDSPALEQAASYMQGRLTAAKKALTCLPSLPARRILYALCDYIACRNF